jgi:ABC-type transport system involved in multi-copper enzyme maturation permease subunit
LNYNATQTKKGFDVIIGPVFAREAQTAPRRSRHYVFRGVYVLTLLIIVCTAWLVVAGTQVIRNVGDMARFGAIVFQILAPLQLALLTFLAAFGVASAVAQEKDRRTLLLLLMTRLTNSELVLGKLFAALLEVLVLLLCALPLFMLITLLGGISYQQVLRVFAVTFTTVIVAGSVGSLFALWREKTFQALSLTALTIAIWIGIWQAVDAGLLFPMADQPEIVQRLPTACSPLLAVLAASQPQLVSVSWALDGVTLYLVFSLVAAAAINVWSILCVRVWNPSREVRMIQQEEVWQGSIWGTEHDVRQMEQKPAAAGTKSEKSERAEKAPVADDRARHIDSYRWKASRKSREVWNNPILWREVRTRAYGRKVLVIQLAYVLMWFMAAAALFWTSSERVSVDTANIIPASARPLAPFFLVSLVIINALAVNSITNERDGQALDLLLVSDISPIEFVIGKLSGVLWVTRLMVAGPMLLAIYLWLRGGVTFENLCYMLIGLAVMDIFAASLGIHCGMNYSNSRSAIGISLGTVFFLFIGVVTCLIIMVSFSGSFQVQYAPFLAFILGGSIGLYVALGYRNPSHAMFWAAALLPAATFFALVSFVLGNRELTICMVVAVTYGFTTAAMLVPAISEFDFAMGRTKLAGED